MTAGDSSDFASAWRLRTTAHGLSAWILAWLRRLRRWVRCFRWRAPREERWRVEATAGRLRALRPQGFARSFDVTVDPVLGRMRARAVEALFARLGLSWVPPEYLELLRPNTTPAAALARFALQFGLSPVQLGQLEKAELERLSLCVEVLLELGLMASLAASSRTTIYALLRARRHEEAATLIARAARLDALAHEAEAVAAAVCFQLAKEFARYLRAQMEAPFSVDEELLEQAPTILRDYRRWQDECDGLAAAIESLLTFADEAFTAEDPWCRDQALLRQGAACRTSEIAEQLASRVDVDIPLAIAHLRSIHEVLADVVTEFRARTGASADVGADSAGDGPTGAAAAEAAWKDACARLGFAEDATPSRAEIDRAFRRRAFAVHPDRCAGPAEEKARRSRELQALMDARRVLHTHSHARTTTEHHSGG